MKPDTAMPDHLHGHVCRYISNPAARDQVLDCIDAALLEAEQRGRRMGMEEAVKIADEYVWDDHALSQATAIGKACHNQSVEIADAIRAKIDEVRK